MFSVKRSQLIFVILSFPSLLQAQVRYLADASGVSLGQAQATLGLLEQYGYIDQRKEFLPRKRDELIDQWTAAYQAGLGAESRSRMFSGDFKTLAESEAPLFVGGEAAVPSLLRPETLVLYSEELPMELIRTHRWRKDEVAPNIFLRPKFWRFQDEETSGIHSAPWLLIYADLMASGDSRQREAALELRKQHA